MSGKKSCVNSRGVVMSLVAAACNASNGATDAASARTADTAEVPAWRLAHQENHVQMPYA